MKNAIAAALFALLSLPALAADYSGKWLLDVAASKDVPQRMTDGLNAWRLDVTQSPAELRIDIRIEAVDETLEQTHRHKLDGTPGTFDLKVKGPDGELTIPTTSIAKVAANGAIDITLSTDFSNGAMRMKRETRERWELSADGKTLTVRRSDVGRDGPIEYLMVFRRA